MLRHPSETEESVLLAPIVDALIADRDRKILLTGGPGIGKSSVIDSLNIRLSKELTPSSVTRIRAAEMDWPGADGQTGKDRLYKWLSSPINVLLIDDLDHIYNEALEIRFRSLAELTDTTQEFRIFATASTPMESQSIGGPLGINEREATRSTQFRMVDSTGLSGFKQIYMDVWKGNWSFRTESAAKDAISVMLSDYRNGEFTDEDIKEKVNQAAIAVREACGGHPRLFRAAISEIPRIVGPALKSGGASRSGGEAPCITDFTEELVVHILETQSAFVINALEWARFWLGDRSFFDFLACVKQSKLDVRYFGEAKWMSAAGIIRREAEHFEYCCKAFELLAQRVTADEAENAEEIIAPTGEVDLIMDALTGIGKLQYRDHENSVSLELPPTEWEVISALDEVKKYPVDVATLAEALHNRHSEPAVRSAINRVQAKCERAGIGWVIRNEVRKGYVFRRTKP